MNGSSWHWAFFCTVFQAERPILGPFASLSTISSVPGFAFLDYPVITDAFCPGTNTAFPSSLLIVERLLYSYMV